MTPAYLLPLPEDWLPVDAARAADITDELHREMIPGHLLYGCAVRAVAEYGGGDDVLFQHLADPARFTLIHLTYIGAPEIDPQHPTVDFDGTWGDFLLGFA